jgi:subtilisin family serine protease
MKRVLTAIALALALAAAEPAVAAPVPAAPFVSAVVVLKSQADLSAVHASGRPARLAAVENALRGHAARTQRQLLSLLSTRRAHRLVDRVVPMWIANEITVHAAPSVIKELAARPEVLTVRPEVVLQAPAAPAAAAAPAGTVEPNVSLVNAPAMWNRGLLGQGVVVANMDTGVDGSQPDLAANWRGGTNSWYDPNGQHPSTPTDVNGHGTWTMGVMVGGNAGGSSVGVAPGASWIAVKIFNDRGAATSSNIHLGFQWLLDPDGNTATPDAPNVVNDSWTMSAAGCVLDFQLDLRSLRAAGILPVFAAGNDGPSAGTVFSPANLPEAFAVGGSDNSDSLDPYSSRGPSACAGVTAPRLTAPDTNIRTTDLYGGYVTETGTSVAAPHVSGALALLLNAFPGLPVAQQEAALQAGAVDRGPPGVDPDFGYGRLDIDAAYRYLATTPDFTITVTPSSVTTAAGGTASYSVSVASVLGFSGDVSLSLAGLSAAQASWTFTPQVVTGGSGTAGVSVTTAATVAPGTYPLTITGTSGSTTHTGTATLVVPGPPDFTMTAAPSSQSVVAGAAAQFAVTVGAVNGFTGTVGLGIAGLSASVGTATFTPASVPTAGTSQLMISTLGSAAPGTYPLTVTGTSGSTSHSVAVTLVVTPPPDFSVAVSPSSRTVNAGASTTYSVTVGALNGFTGNVALSLAGLSASVGTATFAPGAVVNAGTAQLTIKTVATAPAGTYSLTVTGTSGAKTHSKAISLVVPIRGFAVSASPSSRTINRGQATTYTVTVTPTGGFTGSVTLTASGLAGGASATFSVNPLTPNTSSTFRVTTTTSATRGTFTLTITGKNGTLVHHTTVTLTVR